MEQLTEGQTVMVGGTGGAVQVVQMGQGGQAVMPLQAIQVAAPNGQIQVVPVSSLAGAGQQIVIQQPQTPQIIQTPDGQTYIYQPVQIEGQVQQQSQPTGTYYYINIYYLRKFHFINIIITYTVININGNLMQINPTSQTTGAASVQPLTSPAAATQAGNIVMVIKKYLFHLHSL